MTLRDEIIFNLDAILAFAEALNSQINQIDLRPEISRILKLKHEIQKNKTIPYEKQVLDCFNPLIEKIVVWNPSIKNQLTTFWKVQKKIIHQLVMKKDGKPYLPIKKPNDRMRESNKIYKETVEKVKKDDSEMVYFYALFYSHVSRFEIIEEELKEHISENIRRAGLEKEFNPDDIFYVNKKISRGSKQTTDVKAIRDALSHLKFTIKRENSDWKIHFLNNEKGYNFDEEMSKNQFKRFTYDLEILQKSIFALSTILAIINMLGRADPRKY